MKWVVTQQVLTQWLKIRLDKHHRGAAVLVIYNVLRMMSIMQSKVLFIMRLVLMFPHDLVMELYMLV